MTTPKSMSAAAKSSAKSPAKPDGPPAFPPSSIELERGLLGIKKFPSQEAYDAWRAQSWWRRLLS